jgi:hypothetical protein
VAGSCGHSTEPSGRQILDQVTDISFSRRTVLHGVMIHWMSSTINY